MANIQLFAQTKQLSSAIINSANITDEELSAMSAEERAHVMNLRTELEDYRTRFYAQFKRPDPEAPLEKNLRPGASVLRRKQYAKLDNFIQAIIREKQKNNT